MDANSRQSRDVRWFCAACIPSHGDADTSLYKHNFRWPNLRSVRTLYPSSGILKPSEIVKTSNRCFLPLLFGFFVASSGPAFGQGTISIPNGLYYFAYGGLNEELCPTGTHIGVFWGADQNGSAAIRGLGNGNLSTPTYVIGPNPGRISPGGASTYPIPGSTEGQRVWLKIGGWIGGTPTNPTGAQVYGESEPVSVLLGPTAGPGAIWTPPSTGGIRLHVIVPEPSVWALSAVTAGLLLLRRRKQ